MATLFKPQFNTKTVINIGTVLNSLGDGSAAQSDDYDNSTNRYHDVLVQVASNGLSGSTASMSVYVAVSVDGGTTFTDGAATTAQSFTLANLDNSRLLGTIQMNGTTAVESLAMSIRAALGYMPEYFVLIFVNNSGAALASSGHGVDAQGIGVETIVV